VSPTDIFSVNGAMSLWGCCVGCCGVVTRVTGVLDVFCCGLPGCCGCCSSVHDGCVKRGYESKLRAANRRADNAELNAAAPRSDAMQRAPPPPARPPERAYYVSPQPMPPMPPQAPSPYPPQPMPPMPQPR